MQSVRRRSQANSQPTSQPNSQPTSQPTPPPISQPIAVSPTTLKRARIVASIPIPPVYMGAPFMLHGPAAWLGWLQIFSVVALIPLLAMRSDPWLRITDYMFVALLWVYGVVVAWTFSPTHPEDDEGAGVPILI